MIAPLLTAEVAFTRYLEVAAAVLPDAPSVVELVEFA